MQGDSALGRALGLVRELRQRCPWDRAQTPQTIRPYLVGEALEPDQAIQPDDPAAMRDELGDLLLHLAFQIVIAEERSQFNAEVVTRTLEEKMWRRHPNLFGEGRGTRDDHAGWELVKRREPRARGKRSTLAGLPPTLPPLLMAYRLQERAAGIGFDWPGAKGPVAKGKEETAELEKEPGARRREQIEEEIGARLFAAVNLAPKLGIQAGEGPGPEHMRIQRRFEKVEKRAEGRGLEMGRGALEQLEKLWDEV